MTLRRRHPGRAATALGAVVVAVVSAAPVVYLFTTGVSFADIRRQFRYPATTAALWQTVELTVLVSVLTVVVGVGCAVLVVRTDLPAPRLWTVLFAAPLAVPGFISAYAAYSAQLVYLPHTELVTSLPGTAVVMALTLSPYVFLPCVVALRHVDPTLLELATNLRRGHLAGWRHATLPALRPALGAGVLIVALHVLAEFGAMKQLGRTTLTTQIMAEMVDYGNYRSARSLALLLGVLSIVVLVVTGMIAARSSVGHAVSGARRPPPRQALGWARWPVSIAALVLPVAALGPTVVMTVRGLTNRHRSVVTDWSKVIEALWATMGYALAAAAVATLVAFPVSWWISRHRSVVSILTERVVWMAHAVPNAILALALVYLATQLVPGFYKTPAMLVAGYVILFLPLAVGYQRVGLESSRLVYADVAGSLGATPARVFTRITLPLALPGFLAGAILVGLDASKELTTTLMLIPFNTNTLSTRLWATTNGEALDFTAAAPYAMVLVVLGSLPVYALVRHALRELDTHGT